MNDERIGKGGQRIEKRIGMEKELRIIISGGGTGGHIFPPSPLRTL